ncbi:hypothetical protein Tco_0947849 [Tanacetum coccineum]
MLLLSNGSGLNKCDAENIVVRNKTHLVAKGYKQEEGIDFEELFAPVLLMATERLMLIYRYDRRAYVPNSQSPIILLLLLYVPRYQARPTVKHLKEVKQIFRYLRQSYNMGLWYPKDSGFELIVYSDADHAGCKDDCKSTSEIENFYSGKTWS